MPIFNLVVKYEFYFSLLKFNYSTSLVDWVAELLKYKILVMN